MNQSAIIIPFVIIFIYAITLPLEQYMSIGENSKNYTLERIYLANTNTIQTTSVQDNGELEENEPITDLPVIDSPCKSNCSPTFELCIYMCI
ncbi:MAG TPA: hypothetical protein VFR65_11795 [Nitrososphaeraceae archaeon]|nr:hypothetical protein [Nitrososphaeraceae archaeon]